jgi:3-oxoacyl-[acyl-carrier protein] reductase
VDLGLKGRVAIVCAASQGLGKAAAANLAAEGASVVICSRNETRLRAAAEEIRSHANTGASASGGAPHEAGAPEVLPVVADVSLAQDVERLVSTTVERFGRVDILVNNAGGPPVAPFAKLEDGRWMAGVELTLMSVVRLIRQVLPIMQRQRWGRIINITSIAAKQPVNDLVISSTLRPGILGLTKVLANRYGAEGILINSVAPGFILTARQEEIARSRAAERGITREQYLEESAREVPMGRLGRPEELAHVIAFLASERASYIHGATISVDGGLVRGLL